MLQFEWTAGLHAALRHRVLSSRSMNRAASARSEDSVVLLWALTRLSRRFVRTVANEISRDSTSVAATKLVKRPSLQHVIGAELETGTPERRLPVGLLGPSIAYRGFHQKPDPAQGPQYMGEQKPRVVVIFPIIDALPFQSVERLHQMRLGQTFFCLDIDDVEEDVPVARRRELGTSRAGVVVPKEVGLGEVCEEGAPV